jgi:hypothetical protein
MKRLLVLIPLLLSVLLLGLAACDREVVQQVGDDQENAACFTCHGNDGRIEQARGEWQNSAHASGNYIDDTNRSTCVKCHDHQGFLDFQSTGTTHAPYEVMSAIHCFTCHNPHETGDFSLRVDGAVTFVDGTSTFDHGAGNLCVNCHQARTAVTSFSSADYVAVTNRFGPHHGPQGNLLIGTNGYEFDGEEYGSTNHAGAVPGSCAGCHMGNVEAANGYGIGGHSFNMADEEGNDLSGVCANEDCHGEDATSFDIEGIQTDVDSMLTELRGLLVDANVWDDANDEPVTDTVHIIPLAGALFNYVTVKEDRSLGVHNPEYIRDLLETSIAYVELILELRASQ